MKVSRQSDYYAGTIRKAVTLLITTIGFLIAVMMASAPCSAR